MKSKILTSILLCCICCYNTKGQDTLYASVPGTKFLDIMALIRADTVSMNDSSEGGARNRIEAFEQFWARRVSETDSSGMDMFTQYYQGLHEALQTRFGVATKSASSGACQGTGFSGAWEPLGSTEMDRQVNGYGTCIWSAPDQSIMLAGSFAGLFKSTDQGAHWVCLTDNIPIANGIMVVSSIAVNPANTDEIYFGTMNDNIAIDHASAGIANTTHYGAGLFLSHDGGETWEQISLTGGDLDCVSEVFYSTENDDLQHLGVNSPNYGGKWIYACVNPHTGGAARIYRRPATSTINNWVDITAGSHLASNTSDPAFTDIQFVPGSSGNRLFASNIFSGMGPSMVGIYECNISWDGTQYVYDWGSDKITTSANNFPHHANIFARFSISIPKNDITDHYLYAAGMRVLGQNCPIAIYSYDLNTPGVWKVIRNTIPDAFQAQVSNRQRCNLIVSPTNTNNAYVGANLPHFTDQLNTTSGEPTFYPIGSYFPGHVNDPTTWGTGVLDPGPTHCDVRGMFLIPHSSGSATDDVFLYASDGGLSRKNSGVPITPGTITNGEPTHWASRSINGIGFATAHFWNVSTTENGGIAVGGAWHSGMYSYEPAVSEKWHHSSQVYAADGLTGYMDLNRKTAVGNEKTNAFMHHGYSVSGNGREIDDWVQIPDPDFGADQENWFKMPMSGNLNNDRYAGRTSLWRQPNGAGAYVNYNTSIYTPIPLITLESMAFLTNTTSTEPVGYIVPLSSTTATGGGPNYNKIFYRNPPITGFQEFVLTPDGVTSANYVITDVTMDEKNTERVWVSMGQIAPASQNGIAEKRTFYSPDHGDNWYDISKGLPDRMPVFRIKYRQGSEELYCVTDVGAYKMNFSSFDPNATTNHYDVEWECFNNGKDPDHPFPAGYITDLDINYCTGKLYASIYGRSVMATDLFPVTENAGFDDITYTSNQSWTGEHYEIRGNVVVKNNSTLTIGDGTTPTIIHMPRGAHIRVEPGSKLVVDNATLTNSCPECMWDGIIAEGNPYATQTAANQGTVVVKNGSVIEHAKVAFSNGHIFNDVVNQVSVVKYGGYIEAENSSFKNNAIGAKIENYTSYNFLNNPINDKCKFVSCDFVIDDYYKGDKIDLPFEAHASLNAVLGIRFESCSLTNVKTLAPAGNGIGIRAVDASFKVQPHCPGNYTGPCDRSYFSGFRRGVSIEGTMTPGFTPYIDQADFDNSSIGIYISKMNNVSATRNYFVIGNGNPIHPVPEGCYQNIGIFARNSQAFNIRENSFAGTSGTFSNPDWETFGTIIINSGGNNNVIKGNTYTQLKYGGYSMGVNANPPQLLQPGVGLQYQCNIFGGNKNAIFVHSAHSSHGISPWQGYPYLDPGNYFDPNNPNVVDIQNEGYSILYFSLALYLGAPTQNANVTMMTYSPPLGGPEMVSCQSMDQYSHPVKTGGDMVTVHTLNGGISTMKATLASYIDGGNTAALLSYLSTTSISDTDDVYDTLMALSPYLSESVLTEMVDENELTRANQYDVLLANPDVLRYDGFIDYLEALPSPAFSFSQILALKNAVTNITARTTLEGNIVKDYMDVTLEKQAIIRNMMALDDSVAWDTVHTVYEYDLDTLDFLYRDFPTNWADYDLAGLYFRLGDTTEADDILANMPYATFDTRELMEYDRMNLVYTILRDMDRDQRDTFTTEEDSLLTTFAVFESDDNARVLAQNLKVIINDDPGIKAYGPCRTPAERPVPGNNNPFEPLQSLEAGAYVVAVPNPATDKVQFRFDVPNARGQMKISVVNATGQVVKQFICTGTQGSLDWETTQLPAGTYIYRLSDEKGAIATKKLSIIK